MSTLHTVINIVEMFGITRRQIDYWINTGLVKPKHTVINGHGNVHLLDSENILELKILMSLTDNGIAINKIRKNKMINQLKNIIAKSHDDCLPMLTNNGLVSLDLKYIRKEEV